MRIIVFAFYIIFFFTACSSKNTTSLNNTNSAISENFDDSFEDEFENETDIVDPLKYYNIFMTDVNDKLFTYALTPVAKAYDYVVHDNIQKGVSNFFDNILYPIRLVNNLLQFKFENALDETNRFLLNTTFGLLGILDPASSEFNIKAHKEDFGQTLGYWGVGPGFHIVLPFFGPSNLRDTISLGVDGYIDPLFSSEAKTLKIPSNLKESIIINGIKVINTNSMSIGQYENLKKDAIELYPFLRDIYEQKREYEIKE